MGDVRNVPDFEIGNGVYSMRVEAPSLFMPVNNSDEEFFCYNASKLLMEGKYAEAEEEYKFAITLGYRKAVMQK